MSTTNASANGAKDIVRNNGEVTLDELPVSITARQDENGYVLVITSDEKRIGGSNGRLVDSCRIRILDGDVPRVSGVHAIAITGSKARHVGVADARIDEMGSLFVTSAADGVKHRVQTR